MNLTKLDIAALRRADTIIFRQADDIGEVICIKRATHKERKQDPYASDKRYIIKVDTNLNGKHKAFYSAFPEDLTLLASFIRKDDTLSLVWCRDGGNSDLTKEAGLVSDILYIEVFRKDKKYTTLLKQSITKNNSARMIALED